MFSRLLLLINGLSLDAPLVALAWQDIISRHLNVALIPSERFLLFMGTWLVYAGDRLLDQMRPASSPLTLSRHQFVTEHSRLLSILWILAAMLTYREAMESLDARAFGMAVGLLMILMVYFSVCLQLPRMRWLVPREFMVSLFFVAAIFFFPVAISGERITENPVLWSRLLICSFSLAFLNCLGISCWERNIDRQAGETTLATRFQWLPEYYAWICGLTAIALPVIDWLLRGEWTQLGVLGGLTAALLGLLDDRLVANRIRPVLADMVLFVPWVFFFAYSTKMLSQTTG